MNDPILFGISRICVLCAAVTVGLIVCGRGSLSSRGRFRQWSAVFCALVLMLGASARLCAVQVGAGHDFNAKPIAMLLPQSAQSAPPEWVKPGLRLTYYIGVASVAGAGKEWRMDDNGTFVDPQGHHYSGSDKLGIGGQGYQQYDVVGQDAHQIALAQTNYMLNLQEPLTLLSRGGSVTSPGTGGDLWVNPALLNGLSDGMHGGFHVYRAPYKLGTATRASVWIHYASGGSTMTYIYDKSTGVMLHFASMGPHKPTGLLGPDEAENSTNMILYQTTLTEQRMLKLPWMAESIAEWTARVAPMRLQGSLTTSSPGATIMPVRQTFSESITPEAHGANWALLGVALQAGAMSNKMLLVCGSAQIGAIWMSPQALARLEPGQELDRDPVTNVVTRVGNARQASGNTNTVVIQEVGQTFTLSYIYDRRRGNMITYMQDERHPYAIKHLQVAAQQ